MIVVLFTVASPNMVHFRTACLSFVRRISSLGVSACIETAGILGTSSCVLCRETILILECPLSDTSLHLFTLALGTSVCTCVWPQAAGGEGNG